MNIKLFNDDCFNVFSQLEDKSIDCVIVDLPYGQTSCKWDCLIDLDEMWKCLKRVCKKKCNYVFFCTTKFGYQLIKSNEKWFRYDLVWAKSRKVGFLSANKMPLRRHEMVYVFGDKSGSKKTYNPQKEKLDKPDKRKRNQDKEKIPETYGNGNLPETSTYTHRHPDSVLKFTYNPQKREGKPYKWKSKRTNGELYGQVDDTPIDNKGTRHPNTVLNYKNPSKPVHRTQKPIDLCEFLVKSYSNEGDVILDFTGGSMTTGLACLNTNRRFIGIEKDTDIFNKCQLFPYTR